MFNTSQPCPLLILECDATGLEEQQLSLAERLRRNLHARLDLEVPTFRTTDLVSWMIIHRTLALLRAQTVVLIGHGSRSGLRLAEDATGLTPWGLIADRLRPVKPERIIVIAGPHARNSDPGPMFRALPTLQEVIGCPLYLDEERLSKVIDALPLLQGDLGGAIHRQRRGEYESGTAGVMGLRMVEYALR